MPTTTPAHGSLAPGGLCCPTPLRYYDPIRGSLRLLRLSQGDWLYPRSLPDDLVWAVRESVPALGQCSFLTCRHPYAERRNEVPQSALAAHGLPPQNTESAPLFPPHTSFGAGFANDAAVFASCYGPPSCWPSWTDPTWSSAPAAEDVYFRACPGPVTWSPSRVSLHSPPGRELWPDFHRLEHCRYRLHVHSRASRNSARA